MADTESKVHLGFLEEPEHPRALHSKYFPSKAGGKPAWLNPAQLPLADQLTCLHCKNPMTFLLQLYCPIEERDDCFHRTIYVFCCNEQSCQTSGATARFVAVRNQMARANSFYSAEPPPDPQDDEEDEDPEGGKTETTLCVVCGCRAPSRCSGCQAAAYCSRAHQLRHWHAGHKGECKGGNGPAPEPSSCLLPEFEIVNEPEEDEDEGVLLKIYKGDKKGAGSLKQAEADDEDSEESRLSDYEEAVRILNAQRAKEGIDSLDKEDMPFDDSAVQKDVDFLAFQKRIKRSPDQIVRYIRSAPGEAVWVSGEGQPSPEDIPACKACGGPRQLEFQILPQILYYLKIEHDWGLLCVYTCTGSCSAAEPAAGCGSDASAYVDEYVWQQAVSDKATYKLPGQE